MKPLKLLNDLITAVAGLTLGFMTIMVMLQVFYRYVLEAPFPESQEIAVYAMVWVVMLGSTIAVYKKSHIAVNILVDRLSPNAAFAVRLVAYIALAVFFYLLISEGWALTMRSMRQMSPSTGIPVGYVMVSVPFSSAVSLLYVIEQFVLDCRDFAERLRARK